MDWHAWHDDYDRSDSSLARRLRVVQERIRSALDGCPPGPVRVVSLCAGQGRDLLEVLAEHPRRTDVTARLVELDRRNAAAAKDMAGAAGLEQVDVVVADAALTDHYLGMVPADIVLVCGLFGNITAEDIERTIDACRRLCDTGGTVIWTRGRFEPDLIPQICDWFAQRDFALHWLSEPDAGFGVGVHRFTGAPRPLEPGLRMFTFVGRDVLSRTDQRAGQ
ncbi:MAG: class I SAM-dependent methyltransferase family protein [Actinomadura sp.]